MTYDIWEYKYVNSSRVELLGQEYIYILVLQILPDFLSVRLWLLIIRVCESGCYPTLSPEVLSKKLIFVNFLMNKTKCYFFPFFGKKIFLFFILKSIFSIYLITYFWLCSVFIALHQLSLVVVGELLIVMASLKVKHGLQRAQ